MTYIASVTEKGQITIPVEVRRWLKVKSGDQVAFNKKEKHVIIKSAKSFLDLKGSIKSVKTYSDEEADHAVKGYFRKNYARKTARS